MVDITDCNCLNDIARKEFGVANYNNRERVKKLLLEDGIDWKEWKKEKQEEKRKSDIHYCKFCGKEIDDRNKCFCNSSCAAKFNNHQRSLKKRENKPSFCLFCGKELSGRAQKFCDGNCQQRYYNRQYIEKWQNGEESGMSGQYGISKRVRRYLLEKHNYKCEVCGWGEINQHTGTIPLEIHHIDGDYTNNKESNLQVLCPNCHSLTETYKSHNKSGRSDRKKYYLT